MIFHPHLENSRLGILALLGLPLAAIMEKVLKSLTENKGITGPHNWEIASGYIIAAAYCVLLHAYLKWRESRLGYDSPGEDHKLGGIPIRYWSILYLFLGFVCIIAPHEPTQ
jgi:hypothetical protein